MKKTIILASLCIAAAAGMYLGRPSRHPGGNTGEFFVDMTAANSRFHPAEIRVAVGTRVKIRIRAVDDDHGIAFNVIPEGQPEGSPPGLRFATANPDWILKQGRIEEIEFVAERRGHYEFACSVFCGMGHNSMLGRIIVE
jgi:cytochrome c oxidase subunit 2